MHIAATATLAAASWATHAANDEAAGNATRRVAPPPRPAIQTIVDPGEGRDVMLRHRLAHSHNEHKLRRMIRGQGNAPQPAPHNHNAK